MPWVLLTHWCLFLSLSLEHFCSCTPSSAPHPALQRSAHPSCTSVLQPCSEPKHLLLPPSCPQCSWFPSCLSYLFWAPNERWSILAGCAAYTQGRAGAWLAPLWEGKKAVTLFFNKTPIFTELTGRCFAISVLLPNLVEVEFSSCWHREATDI